MRRRPLPDNVVPFKRPDPPTVDRTASQPDDVFRCSCLGTTFFLTRLGPECEACGELALEWYYAE